MHNFYNIINFLDMTDFGGSNKNLLRDENTTTNTVSSN